MTCVTYATWLIQAGATVNDVQWVMGLEQASTTPGIYTHVSDGLNGRVLGALAAFSLPSADEEPPETTNQEESDGADQQE
jgi:hypothetical protein